MALSETDQGKTPQSAPSVQAQQGSRDSKDHIRAELDAIHAREAAEEKRQNDISQETARVSAIQREEFEQSEQADVHRQIAEAERIMRLPTPQALEALGSVVGDPTKGPSS